MSLWNAMRIGGFRLWPLHFKNSAVPSLVRNSIACHIGWSSIHNFQSPTKQCRPIRRWTLQKSTLLFTKMSSSWLWGAQVWLCRMEEVEEATEEKDSRQATRSNCRSLNVCYSALWHSTRSYSCKVRFQAVLRSSPCSPASSFNFILRKPQLVTTLSISDSIAARIFSLSDDTSISGLFSFRSLAFAFL